MYRNGMATRLEMVEQALNAEGFKIYGFEALVLTGCDKDQPSTFDHRIAKSGTACCQAERMIICRCNHLADALGRPRYPETKEGGHAPVEYIVRDIAVLAWVHARPPPPRLVSMLRKR